MNNIRPLSNSFFRKDDLTRTNQKSTKKISKKTIRINSYPPILSFLNKQINRKVIYTYCLSMMFIIELFLCFSNFIYSKNRQQQAERNMSG
jgi:hypothetical protein